MSIHCGLSPTIAGCSALTRLGASSITSVRTRLVTAPLTVVTVVDPGYGRSRARPPKIRMRTVAQARQQRVDHLRVADELERDEPQRARDVVLGDLVGVALDRGEDEVVHVADVRECVGDRVRLGEVEPDPACRAADLVCGRLGAGLVPPVTTTSRPSSA